MRKKQRKNHIKIGDKVKVISGSQKGFLGKIVTISPRKTTSLVVVEGIAPRVKYVKNRQTGESQKMELPLGIDISNVMLWDELQNLASRTGSKQVEGKKRRYFIKSKNLVEEA